MTSSRSSALMSQPDADELAGQPVEQLRVARQLALRAEVLLGLDQADAEELRPERLTATRAVSGFSGSTSQRARPSRSRGAPSGSGWNAAGTPGSTASPGSRKFPLTSRCVSRRLSAGSSDHHRHGRASAGPRPSPARAISLAGPASAPPSADAGPAALRRRSSLLQRRRPWRRSLGAASPALRVVGARSSDGRFVAAGRRRRSG